MSATEADPFGEEWFGPASQQALADLYENVRHLEGRVVEVGCWTGRSTCALANACHPETVWAVDTWKGSPGEVSAELAKQRNVFSQFKANVRRFTKGNVTPVVGPWRSFFAGTRNPQPIKFLHIDATHTYEEVRDNIAAALPLMVKGGVICGDDVHHPPIQRAVLEAFPEAQVAATLWWTVIGGD